MVVEQFYIQYNGSVHVKQTQKKCYQFSLTFNNPITRIDEINTINPTPTANTDDSIYKSKWQQQQSLTEYNAINYVELPHVEYRLRNGLIMFEQNKRCILFFNEARQQSNNKSNILERIDYSNPIELKNSQKQQSSKDSYQFWHVQIFDLVLNNYSLERISYCDGILVDGLILALQFGKSQSRWDEDQQIDNLNLLYQQIHKARVKVSDKINMICQFLDSQMDFQEILQVNPQLEVNKSTNTRIYGCLVWLKEQSGEVIDLLRDIFTIGFDSGRGIISQSKEQVFLTSMMTLLEVNQQSLSLNSIHDRRYLKDLLLDELIWTKQSSLYSLVNRLCTICLDKIDFKNLVKVESCQHSFHKRCLASYVEQQLSYSSNSIKCPEVCSHQLTMNDFESMFDECQLKNIQEQMNKKLFQENFQEYQTCLTPNCNYTFIFEGDRSFQFLCPTCLKTYCLSCKTPYHFDMSCQQFRESPEYASKLNSLIIADKSFQDMVRKNKWRQCPNCHIWLEKVSGCMHITCQCKYEFCYRCGGKYQECACGG